MILHIAVCKHFCITNSMRLIALPKNMNRSLFPESNSRCIHTYRQLLFGISDHIISINISIVLD